MGVRQLGSDAADAVRALFALWRHLQISHRGKFSVERLQALEDYTRHASLLRVVLLCAVTPVPALVLAIALESLPLRDPSEGWKANYMSWIRYQAVSFVISLGLVLQVKQMIPGLAFSMYRSLVIAIGTSVLHVALIVYISTSELP